MRNRLHNAEEMLKARIAARTAPRGEIGILHLAEPEWRRDEIKPHRGENLAGKTVRGLLHHP